MLIKEDIDPLLFKGNKKDIEIMNGKFVDKSIGDAITNKVIVCTSTITTGQSTNDNICKSLYKHLS